MDIIRFAIGNPVKVAVGSILLCIFGVLSILEIPKQLTPDVDQPVVTVETFWSGSSPQEIASEIVDRQEERLKSVSGLQKMTSESIRGKAKVSLEFNVGVNKDTALSEVSEKLRQVSGYPEEVDEPTVTAGSTDMSRTIAWIMMRGPAGIDVAKMKTFVEDRVKPILERAEGISSVDVYGGREREMQIEVDPYKLAARSLTFRDLERAIRSQNENISGGDISQGKRDYTYRTIGEFTSVEDIADTVIAYRKGGPVKVSDVATVVNGFKKPTAFVRSKGDFVIAIPARRETGANVLTAMENLKRQIDIVNAEILPTVHPDLHLDQVYDETIYIQSAIGLVTNNILVGGLLAIVVLLAFLRSGSATAIVGVAIPISVIGTFLIIAMLGRTMNVVLLAGMAFAVGMVVDNAIVVLENIFRHRQMGKTRGQAAYDGATEVWGAVLASTLTTMAVFLPVVFIKEEAGQLFGDIAVAISSAVALSLIISILVIPPLSARLLGKGANQRTDDSAWFLARWFAAVVGWINRRVTTRLAVIVGLTGLSVLGSWQLMPATDYLPAGNRNLVFGFLVSPPGYTLDEFRHMANIVEDGAPDDPDDGIRPAWEAEVDSPQAANLAEIDVPLPSGQGQAVTVRPPPIDNFFFVTFGNSSFMGCTSKVDSQVSPLVEVMKTAGARIPGVYAFFAQSSLFGRGLSGGSSIELEIRASDQKKVVSAAKAVQMKIMRAGFSYPRPSPSNFSKGKPEIRIIPDRAKAADLGLNVRDIGFNIEACANGAFVGEFNDHGDRIDLVLLVEGTKNATVQEIGQIPIYTPSGSIVPLEATVDMVPSTAAQQINHVEEMDAVTLAISLPQGEPLQSAMDRVRNDIIAPLRESGVIDPSVIVSMAGNADKLTTTQRALIGDFRNTVRWPVWFGGSVGKTLLILLACIGLVVAATFLVGNLRWAINLGGGLFVLTLLAFLFANPDFSLMLFQSRVALAVLIVYLLMAALFESFIYPLVILFSVPLAAVGGFAALRWVHVVSLTDISVPVQNFDVLTMLGFVILLGIVVNNAILVVHQSLVNIREYGMSASDAVKSSVSTRTRPIFMTATTSIFGMLPLVLMTGAGSELYRGLGSVVVGGLLFSTIFTLFVVPTLLSLVLGVRARIVGDFSAATASGSLPTSTSAGSLHPAPANRSPHA